ncbi:MAG TPA: enoyl-CoA hydratase-related protein, partial [Pseudorhodoferax sp.]|nr:enoyl-CoA hydratase-related protein [Pseudorhodoferax sp.]
GAAFHVGAVRIGLTAGECGISYHLPRLIGAARAFELMLTGRPLPADEAERVGLVASVVPAEELLPRALALAEQVLRNSPYATRHTKQLMWANLEAPSLQAAIELENRAQVLALMTEDFREAVAAFGEKRPPRFTGR